MKLISLCVAATLSASVLAAPAAAQEAEAVQPAAQAKVEVGPRDDGNWFVRYTFDAPQPVYAFAHSTTGYRPATWAVETEGVRFGRLDGLDVITGDGPLGEVEFSIIPLTGQLPDDPTPFVTFTGGGIAVHDAQFELVGFSDVGAVEALEGNIDAAASSGLITDITVIADGPVMNSQQAAEDSLTARVRDQYLYIGDGEFEAYEGFSMLADPYLPDWIESNLPDAFEGFLKLLEANWGSDLNDDISLIIAYKGGEAQGLSLHGSVLDSQIMLELGGQGFASPNSDALAYLHWYTIRELVGLFQTRDGIVFGGPEASWIQSGFANSIAYQLIASQMQSPEAFLSSVYEGAFEDCVTTLEGGPLETAIERGAVSGTYACGDFIALATDGYLAQRNLFGFWDALSDWASRTPDKTVDSQVYFTTLQLLGAAPAQRERVRALVEDDLDKPRAALRALLEDAGLKPQFTANGRLSRLDWPDYSEE
ncbi:hypothetical protein [Henriciella marina]|uniref:hypothetical protein n=1 Tax=Henriciella marina TaxID=453851 RepID=UPI000375E7B6|nr:hypothetical protein [Henriciella marina]